jgi:ribosome-interacting GTPase 1
MPGMMHFEDIQIQLVDMPPIVEEGVEHWFPQLVRGADASLLVVDVTSPTLLEDVELVQEEMERANISLIGSTGENQLGDQEARDSKVVAPTATSMPGAPHALVHEGADGETKTAEARAIKRTLVVANKIDVECEPGILALLEEYLGGGTTVVPFSALTRQGADALNSKIFGMLDLVRVYTKVPGKKPDLNRPFVLPSGSTILDVASLVHKDFAASLRFARIWGAGVFDGQCVEKDHVVKDKDVVELHL